MIVSLSFEDRPYVHVMVEIQDACRCRRTGTDDHIAELILTGTWVHMMLTCVIHETMTRTRPFQSMLFVAYRIASPFIIRTRLLCEPKRKHEQADLTCTYNLRTH